MLILCSVDYKGLLNPCCNSVNKSKIICKILSVYLYRDKTKPGSLFSTVFKKQTFKLEPIFYIMIIKFT